MSKTTFTLGDEPKQAIKYEVDAKKPNLYQKICIIMQKVSSVYKDAKVQTGRDGSYKAVSHDNVAALLHSHLAEQGIVVRPSVVSRNLECVKVTNQYGEKDQFRTHLVVDVAFINADNPNERESCVIDGFALDSQDKGVGKSLSYAVKYAMLKMFVLESSDEEENREPEFKTKDEVKPIGNLHATAKADTAKHNSLLSEIKGILANLTNSMTANEKVDYFFKVTGRSWSSVKDLNINELELVKLAIVKQMELDI